MCKKFTHKGQKWKACLGLWKRAWTPRKILFTRESNIQESNKSSWRSLNFQSYNLYRKNLFPLNADISMAPVLKKRLREPAKDLKTSLQRLAAVNFIVICLFKLRFTMCIACTHNFAIFVYKISKFNYYVLKIFD